MKLILLASFHFIICEAKKQAHWTDFVPKKEATQTNDKAIKPISQGSHRTLNAKSKRTILIREEYIQSEIELGHTARKNFIPLLNNRDHHESNVNNAMIGGIVLRKLNKYQQSKSLFEYAHEQRIKSQNIQKQMNHIKKAGDIDCGAKCKDLKELSRARINYRYKNDPKFKEKYRARAKIAKQRRMQLVFERKRKGTDVADLNRSSTYASILFIICKAKKQAHWTDFVPNRNSDENENHATARQPNDSNNLLNLKSKENKLLGDQIKNDVPAGHTNRKNLIPLIVQRDKQEEKVNHALIGGIIARKLKHQASHCLFNCAFEERIKSKQIQKQFDQIKSEGHIDQKVEKSMLRLRHNYAQRLKRKYEHNSNEVKDWQDRQRRESKNDRYHQVKRMKRQ